MTNTIPQAQHQLPPGELLRRLTAAEARVEGLYRTLLALGELPGGGPAAAAYTDPATARVQARKRRIEASGLLLIRGGAA